MARSWRSVLGLCLPLALAAAADCSLTLSGQPEAYWAGDYSQVREGSPVFRRLLNSHPAAFVVGWWAYVGVLAGLILLLPRLLALTTGVAATTSYAWGASTWLWFSSRLPYRYQTCNVLFLLVGLALSAGIYWGWLRGPEHGGVAGWHWPAAVRWAMIGALFGVVVYVAFWPHRQ
jgi:hypothetical protein